MSDDDEIEVSLPENLRVVHIEPEELFAALGYSANDVAQGSAELERAGLAVRLGRATWLLAQWGNVPEHALADEEKRILAAMFDPDFDGGRDWPM